MSGTAEAEEEFSLWFLPRLRAFFRARGADPSHGDDLTQETVLLALRSLRQGRLRQSESLESYVLGVARRLWAESCRGRARMPTSPLEAEPEHKLPASSDQPEWTLAVRREFDLLDPINQRILWLTIIEGYRTDEVARLVGMTGDLVRQRKSRILRRMARNLGLADVTNRPAARPILWKESPSP